MLLLWFKVDSLIKGSWSLCVLWDFLLRGFRVVGSFKAALSLGFRALGFGVPLHGFLFGLGFYGVGAQVLRCRDRA